jgi:hypothetical protein
MGHRDLTADQREEIRKTLSMTRIDEIIVDINELERDDEAQSAG